jgi:hypothetical protein
MTFDKTLGCYLLSTLGTLYCLHEAISYSVNNFVHCGCTKIILKWMADKVLQQVDMKQI